MKVLVTGASGFIGKHLVDDLIKHGYEVRALTRLSSLEIKDVTVVRGDITKPETLSPAFDGVEAVFHNAAYAMDWGKKSEIYRSNVEGTLNVAEACMKKGVDRIVYTSSAGVYGFPNTSIEITENAAKKPLNTYQKSKLEAENVLKRYKSLHISIVRPPLILGDGGRATSLILSKMEQGKMIYIGNGNQDISLVHPKDVAQCLRLTLEQDEGDNIFNVVSFICKIKELLDEIANQLHVEPPKRHVPYFLVYGTAFFAEMFATKEPSLTRFRVKSLGTTRKISCERAMKELGYEPKCTLVSMVKDMVSWYKNLINK